MRCGGLGKCLFMDENDEVTNDGADIFADLDRKLLFIGCPPYYLFQGRPTAGNEPYMVPIVRGWEIFAEAMLRGSGLARRARAVG